MSQAYDFNVRCPGLARDYSSILYRRRPSSALSSPLSAAPLTSFVSPNNENTTRRDFWTKCVRWTDGCCVERNAAARSASRMELKRVSCGCFGRRSFAMSPLTLLAPTTLVDRDLELHFNSEMLAKLLRNRRFLHRIVPK